MDFINFYDMKNNIIFMLLLSVFFAACNNNEPNNVAAPQKALPNGLQSKKCTSYLEWLLKDNETIVDYSFCNASSENLPVYNTAERYTDDNTIMFTDKIGLRIHDSYTIERDEKNTVFHITRQGTIVENPKTNNAPSSQRAKKDDPLIEVTFDVSQQTALPIYFTRPSATRCYSIPLCYYDEMKVEWPADYSNQTGVIILAEWNGLQLDGSSTDTTIVHHAEYEDTGSAILDSSIFAGMPDEALVTMWIIRANIVTILCDHEAVPTIDWEDMANNNATELTELIVSHPEVITYYQTLCLSSASVGVLPIYLIRGL